MTFSQTIRRGGGGGVQSMDQICAENCSNSNPNALETTTLEQATTVAKHTEPVQLSGYCSIIIYCKTLLIGGKET